MLVGNKQDNWKFFHRLDSKKNFPIININFIEISNNMGNKQMNAQIVVNHKT